MLIFVLRCLRFLGAVNGAAAWLGLAAAFPAWSQALEPGRVLPAARAVQAAGFERTPGTPPQTVALPHDWRALGLVPGHVARYRLTFEVPASAAQQPWSLWSARWPLAHRVSVNGHLVSDQWALGAATAARTAPGGAELPPLVLRPGLNEVLIDERGGLRAGLGPVWVGPAMAVHNEARRHRRWTTDLPRVLNGASAGAALFALLLWVRRRSERTAAWFGLFALIISVRNMAYVEPGSPTPVGGSLLLYGMTCGVTLLFAYFGAQFAGPAGRRLTHAVGALALLCTGAGAWTLGHVDQLDALRVWIYPLLLLVALPAVVLMLQASWRRGHRHSLLLTVAGITLLASGVHDYLLQAGRLDPMRGFLFPWTAPLLALAYALVMGGRIAQALTRSERYGEQLEEEVRQRTSDLAHANEDKSRFLAAASHDLRQPLVAIGLLVGLLKEQLHGAAPQRLVARIDEAVAAMERLLRGLLDLSRLDSGTRDVRREAVHLMPLLQDIMADAQALAQAQGLRLLLRVSPRATVAWCDPLLLEQIVRNLVANAVRYTARGGVLVSVRPRQGQLLLQVWDTGAGIAPAQQQRVFDDFVQLDNAHRDRHQGLGLGLAIVRRAAQALGVTVRLASQPGRGSCFALSLPASRLPGSPATRVSAGAARPSPQAEARRDGAPLRGVRVWLVEDDAEVRAALHDRLSDWGADVHASADAEAAMARAEQAMAPALLVTDMRLPGLDGLALAAALRQRWPALRVLVLTGNTAPADLMALHQTGVPVLHKPFRSEALYEAVLRALQSVQAGVRPAD